MQDEILYIFTASLRRGFPELSLDLEGDCGDMQICLAFPDPCCQEKTGQCKCSLWREVALSHLSAHSCSLRLEIRHLEWCCWHHRSFSRFQYSTLSIFRLKKNASPFFALSISSLWGYNVWYLLQQRWAPELEVRTVSWAVQVSEGLALS